mmetsp:Transcript_4006/g.543  ORF Transcript_4006/g.543 Transcript_4006/m.543 type:complete len:81 (-) Transcript_4006:117-359(-)
MMLELIRILNKFLGRIHGFGLFRSMGALEDHLEMELNGFRIHISTNCLEYLSKVNLLIKFISLIEIIHYLNHCLVKITVF